MIIKNRDIGSLFFSLTILAACQAAQKPQDESLSAQDAASGTTEIATASNSSDSEGVVGPDEAFFAGIYLEHLFQYSKENNNPSLDEGAASISLTQPISAFEFAANFSDKRVGLMVKSLYLQGDTDSDGSLSETEFASLKFDPALLGLPSESSSHAFAQTLFLRVAGEDEQLQTEECVNFLKSTGPAVKAMLDRSSAQDQRLSLIRSWEKVLGRYDADQNGSLSLQEQRELRKDRAQLISKLGAE